MTPCWLWGGAYHPDGYGQSRANTARGRQEAAHRVSYELLVGPIPTSMQLDHLCRNRGCVNPEHLEPVTNGENHRRARGYSRRTLAECGHLFTERFGKRRCWLCYQLRHNAYRRLWRTA